MKNGELHEKLSRFIEKLNEWRSMARTGSLSELIWQVYRDTHFYDFVGGLPQEGNSVKQIYVHFMIGLDNTKQLPFGDYSVFFTIH